MRSSSVTPPGHLAGLLKRDCREERGASSKRLSRRLPSNVCVASLCFSWRGFASPSPERHKIDQLTPDLRQLSSLLPLHGHDIETDGTSRRDTGQVSKTVRRCLTPLPSLWPRGLESYGGIACVAGMLLALRSRSEPPFPPFGSGEMGRVLGARGPWQGQWQTPPESVMSPAGAHRPDGRPVRLAENRGDCGDGGIVGRSGGRVSGRISVLLKQGETSKP